MEVVLLSNVGLTYFIIFYLESRSLNPSVIGAKNSSIARVGAP